jgi:hypothetical protein
VPSFLGAIYSAILYATTPYGPQNDNKYVQLYPLRDRFGQGGFQIVGLLITVGIGAAAGALIGLVNKFITREHT